MDGDEPGTPGDACAWNNGACEGTVHCPPRCPRFFSDDGEPMLVQSYRATDRPSLVAMYLDLADDSRTLGLPPSSRDGIEAWLDHLAAEGWNLVARRAGEIVGHLGTAPADDAVPEFVVFVHQAVRERGVGRALLRHAIAHAADRGHDGLSLVTDADNRAAIRAFRTVAFEITDRPGLDVKMELACDQPIAAAVQRPPAEWEDA